jgi:hypothetical protein
MLGTKFQTHTKQHEKLESSLCDFLYSKLEDKRYLTVSRQTLLGLDVSVHTAHYFWGNLSVRSNLKDQKGDERTTVR